MQCDCCTFYPVNDYSRYCKEMKKVAFTFVSDNYYYPSGTPKFINSFRYFHPDVDLVVFRDDILRKLFQEKSLTFYNAKPSVAKLLTDKYDLVIQIDSDTVITARLESVLAGDYEVGTAWNFNQYENSAFENITSEMYLQAGLVASTSKKFWDDWERANAEAMKYTRKENDVLNKVVYGEGVDPKYKLKIFDKDYGYMGCKSLGQEEKMYVKDGELWLNKEKVFAYHHAKGPVLPKLLYDKMGFTWEVQRFLEKVSFEGQSVKIIKP